MPLMRKPNDCFSSKKKLFKYVQTRAKPSKDHVELDFRTLLLRALWLNRPRSAGAGAGPTTLYLLRCCARRRVRPNAALGEPGAGVWHRRGLPVRVLKGPEMALRKTMVGNDEPYTFGNLSDRTTQAVRG